MSVIGRMLGISGQPPAAAAAQGQASSGGSGQVVTTTTTSAGTITTSMLGQLQVPPPLTQQEQYELEALRADFNKEVKAAKLNIFKAMPAELRQEVINMLEWDACRNNMNQTSLTMSQRQQELEVRELQRGHGFSRYGGIFPGSLSSHLTHGYGQMLVAPILPDGITLEDLKVAHLEATLEENMVEDDTNS